MYDELRDVIEAPQARDVHNRTQVKRSLRMRDDQLLSQALQGRNDDAATCGA